MLRKLLDRLRGSSRAPDDLAVATTRPGDFADPPAEVRDTGEGAVEPNPRDEEEPGYMKTDDEGRPGQ
jgi:hypothetical protein